MAIKPLWREEDEEPVAGNVSEEMAMEIKRFNSLVRRAENLIDQIQGLYHQYMVGLEDRAPREQRNNLELLMQNLQHTAKPTTMSKFKYRSVFDRFIAFRDRWDRLMKDLESGRIQRLKRGKNVAKKHGGNLS